MPGKLEIKPLTEARCIAVYSPQGAARKSVTVLCPNKAKSGSNYCGNHAYIEHGQSPCIMCRRVAAGKRTDCPFHGSQPLELTAAK